MIDDEFTATQGMNDSAQFETYRPLMFSIAYRMLGSATEAEDILQEAFLRYRAVNSGEIRSHKAFLSTMVTRLCVNQLQSEQHRRETYIGPWLPEPVLTPIDDSQAPAREAELHESISIAFLTLMEQLSPLERAVFLLREVFDYSYAEIAEILDREETACRQVFSRARKHIAAGQPRFKPTPEAHRRIVEQFTTAAASGDMQTLTQMLSDDVILWADGGGKARGAAIHPLYGRDAVLQFVLASMRRVGETLYPELAEVNGELAVIVRVASGNVVVVLWLGLDGERVNEIRVMGNPDKLAWVSGGKAANT